MADEKKKDTRKEYVYIGAEGSHTAVNEDGERFQPKQGDKVRLTDAQYNSFRDRFADPDAQKQSKPTNDVDKAAAKVTEPNSETQPVQNPPNPPVTPATPTNAAGNVANAGQVTADAAAAKETGKK